MPHRQAWNLKDGVAVVTGAAGGLGAGLALSLGGRGCHLALVDRDGLRLQAVAQAARAMGVQVSTHHCDLADAAALDALPAELLAAHPRVSLLVNNAGVALGGSFLQLTPQDFDWLMAVNFNAPVRLTRALLPALSREGRARIVNISSIFGIVAPAGQTAYSASKFALRGFSEALRHELWLAGSTVGLTVVHPGGVDTGIARSARVSDLVDAQQREQALRTWARLPKLAPLDAAESIVQAIERGDDRLVLGRDARGAELLQRLMPVRYFRHMAKRMGLGSFNRREGTA